MKTSFRIVILLFTFMTACATTEYMPSEGLRLNPAYFRTLKEPSLYKISQEKPEAEQYRLMVLSGITPIHSVRLKANTNGSGRVVVKVANKGIRLQGKNDLKNRKLRKVSSQEMTELRNHFSELGFQDIYSDQTVNEDDFWIHATLLCYESARNGQYHIVCDSTGNVTKITHTLLPQFYRLGGIDSKADWSLYEYFGLDKIE